MAQKEEARRELDELMDGKILKFKNEELFDEAFDEQQFRDIKTLRKILFKPCGSSLNADQANPKK